jgi:hypothetical protein
LTGASRINAENLLWAVRLILTSKPGNDSEYLTSLHRKAGAGAGLPHEPKSMAAIAERLFFS